VARTSYVHPLVQDAFMDEAFDPAPLFTGPQRAGLTRGETALLRLLKRKAEKRCSCTVKAQAVCHIHHVRRSTVPGSFNW
jgi:DNA topoisomerase IB